MAAANQPVAAQLTTATRDDSNVSAGTSQAGAEATPGERLRAQVGAPKQPLTVPVAQPREQWLAVLDNVVSLLRNRDGAPAPIEERSAGSSGVRPAARSTPDVLAQVTASPRMRPWFRSPMRKRRSRASAGALPSSSC